MTVTLCSLAQSAGPLGAVDTPVSKQSSAALLRQGDGLPAQQAPSPRHQGGGHKPYVPNRVQNGNPEPFGARLFRGGFSNNHEDGLNPDYQVQPGDRITVRVWGAVDYNDVQVVDPQGNLFIPSVGPVSVAGVTNRNLNNRVQQTVSSVFTDNVMVYTSLNGTQPVAVFVTGFVPAPGRFGGIPSNSPLHFLDRAVTAT